jgi:hypothetical protein
MSKQEPSLIQSINRREELLIRARFIAHKAETQLIKILPAEARLRKTRHHGRGPKK